MPPSSPLAATNAGRLLRLNVRVDRGRNQLIGTASPVLVDDRGPFAVVSHPGHQVSQPGAAYRRKVIPGVAKIVEMQAFRADAVPAIAALISSCAASQNVPGSNLRVQCTENRTGQDPTNGGVAGHGRCTLTGALHDSGSATDYRTVNGTTALIRRVVTGAKGTITFVIKINLADGGGEPWTITSGTKTYTKLHGRGHQAVNNYQGTPATFVLKGTVPTPRLKIICPESSFRSKPPRQGMASDQDRGVLLVKLGSLYKTVGSTG